MKKNRLKKIFLDDLRKTPVVSAVCSKLNLSRQTVYRWRDEDDDFSKEYDICLSQGRDNINDLAESKLINKIQNNEMGAIVYWLDNNNKRYIKPRYPLDRNPEYKGVTKFSIQLYQNGNKKETYSGKTKPEEKVSDEPEALE